ncbi:MAG: hypothetical protein GX920_03885 [Micrococcus sp.]|nr:hypothetical protein [Micrococcus sp.]
MCIFASLSPGQTFRASNKCHDLSHTTSCEFCQCPIYSVLRRAQKHGSTTWAQRTVTHRNTGSTNSPHTCRQ